MGVSYDSSMSSALLYGLQGPRDLLAKLKREAAKLEGEVDSDNVFNFVVTAWHLQEWIGKSASLPAAAAKDLQQLRKDPRLQICRDIANASKHVTLTYVPSVTKSTVVPPAVYGQAVYGMSKFGGKADVDIEAAGVTYSMRYLKNEVVQLYEDFFLGNGIS